MKISMILTSLVVAMSAVNLTGCDNTGKTDVVDQSPDVIEKVEEMKEETTDTIQPVPPAE
ncbi:MAG: hypothetical protein V7749_15635 [Cocleimonas sp.]